MLLPMRVSSSNVIAEFVRYRIRQWLGANDRHGNRTELAKLLGVTPSHIGQARDANEGKIGPSLIEGIAKMEFGGSHDALQAAAEAWWKTQAPVSVEPTREPRIVRESRYPNRDAAAIFARARGLSEVAIDRVMGEALHSSEDLPPDLWLAKMQTADAAIRTEGLAVPKVARGVPISPDEDDELRRDREKPRRKK